MGFLIQLISTHPLAVNVVVGILRSDQVLRRQLLTTPCVDLNSKGQQYEPCLFLLDTCSLPLEFTDLCRLLRVRCPGSKFLALVHPEASSHRELLRLLYMGIDGSVSLTDQLKGELLRAVRAILYGNLWFPTTVLQEYAKQTKLMLDKQLQPDSSLTARENQIFQLMVRRFSNCEIGAALGISERTVKFHVSNVFTKLHVHSRRALLEQVSGAADTSVSNLKCHARSSLELA